MGGKDPFIVCADVADADRRRRQGRRLGRVPERRAGLHLGRALLRHGATSTTTTCSAFVDYTEALRARRPAGPEHRRRADGLGAPAREGRRRRSRRRSPPGAELVTGGGAGGQRARPLLLPGGASPARPPRPTCCARRPSARSRRSCRCASLDEAIELANSTRYGLGANVYTRDLQNVVRCMREIKAGTVLVQRPADRQRRRAVRRLQAVGPGPRAGRGGPRGLPGDQARPHRDGDRAEGVVVPVRGRPRDPRPPQRRAQDARRRPGRDARARARARRLRRGRPHPARHVLRPRARAAEAARAGRRQRGRRAPDRLRRGRTTRQARTSSYRLAEVADAAARCATRSTPRWARSSSSTSAAACCSARTCASTSTTSTASASFVELEARRRRRLRPRARARAAWRACARSSRSASPCAGSYSDLLLDGAAGAAGRRRRGDAQRLRAVLRTSRSAPRCARPTGGDPRGANVENAAYPQGQCAEASAIGAHGRRRASARSAPSPSWPRSSTSARRAAAAASA